MSTLGGVKFTLPPSPKDPYFNPEEKGVILLSGHFSKEASSLIKITRYVILLASYILPFATGATAIDMKAVQKGLYDANAFSDFTKSGFETKKVGKEVSKIKEAFSKWSREEGSKRALAREVTSSGIAIVQSLDDLLYAGQALGLGTDALAVTLHAFAYGGTAFTMIKSYVELAQTIEDAKNDPDKLWVMRIKKVKFVLATFAAGFGLSTLFFKATFLSILWAIFAGGTASLSAMEYFYETAKNGGESKPDDFATPKFALVP